MIIKQQRKLLEKNLHDRIQETNIIKDERKELCDDEDY